MSAVTFSRISFLSRLAVCPSAWAESEGKPSIKSDASALGDAFHEWMATTYTTIETIIPDQLSGTPFADALQELSDGSSRVAVIRNLANKHMCDEGALLDLIQKNTFDPDGGERELPVVLKIPAGDGCPEIHVPGTADWVKLYGNRISIPTPTATVVDYKTSAHPEHTIPIQRDLQLLGYSVAVADKYGVDRVTAIKYYPILGDEGYEHCEVYLEDARKQLAYVVRRAWRESGLRCDACAGTGGLPPGGGFCSECLGLGRLPINSAPEYRPNNMDWSVGCKGCPGVVTCQAARFAHQRALRLLGHDQPTVTTQNAREVYESLRLLGAAQKFKSDASSALVELIDATGPIPMDDTHEIRVVESGKARYPQACRKQEE